MTYCIHKSGVRCNTLKHVVFLVALVSSVNVLADTRVTPVNEPLLVDSNGCSVTVYQTSLAAQKNGAIEEICLIEGSVSGSSRHTTEKAIESSAHEACGCGTDKVYVKARSRPTNKSAHVVMVAFRYTNDQVVNVQQIDPYEAIKWKNAGKSIAASDRIVYTNSGTVQPVDTGRAFKDDYGFLPARVKSWKPKGTVWNRK